MIVTYHRSVLSEIYAACDFYDSQAPGLGSQFFEELATLIESIPEPPKRWPPLIQGDPRRKALMKRFPYAVIYEEGTDSIRILIVRHQARRPGYGERRT